MLACLPSEKETCSKLNVLSKVSLITTNYFSFTQPNAENFISSIFQKISIELLSVPLGTNRLVQTKTYSIIYKYDLFMHIFYDL